MEDVNFIDFVVAKLVAIVEIEILVIKISCEMISEKLAIAIHYI